MRLRLLASAAFVLALAGCTPAAETPTPLPTPTLTAAPSTVLSPDLVPLALGVVTEENAAVEAARLVDALQALVEPGVVTGAVNESQVIPTTDDLPPFFALKRTLTLDPAYDPIVLGQTLAAVLEQSTWVMYQTANRDGVYLADLSGGPEEAPWFFVLEAKTVDGVSTLAISIASPDLVA